MTEEQLNENIIRSKIQCICQDCMYLEKIVPILNQMLNETYIDGLEQGKFDKEMDTMYDNTKKSRLTNTTKELHSLIDKNDLAHIVKENNQYYEPTITTVKNIRYPKRIFFEEKEYIPKQQLIDFLKDKIRQNEKRQEQFCYEEPGYSYCEGIDDVLQEVLDFVRKDKK